MDFIKKGFGEKLKDIRKIKSLTQEKLAEKIGVNLRQLARIEAGESFITSETLYNICTTLEVSPSVLFNFEIQDELLKTGTDDKVHFSAIKSGNIIKLTKENYENNRRNKEVVSDIDVKMQITAKKLNKEIIIDEIVDGAIVQTKTYLPNGEVKVEEKKQVNKQYEQLKEAIVALKDDSKKINFLNLAIKALTQKEALLELKAQLNGIELMYSDRD